MAPSNPPVVRLWFAVFFGYLAFGATLQALPQWVPRHLGGGPVAVGLAVGVAFAATAVSRPVAGRAGDAGLARAVVVGGGLLIAAGAVGQLAAPNLAVLLIARLVMGVGEAGLFSAALPWVLADVSPTRRATVAGRFGLSMWGGLALGPLVTAAATALGGLNAAWWAVIVLGALASGCALATPRSQRGHGRLRVESWREIVPRGAALPGVTFGLGAYGYGTISSGLVLFLSQPGFGASSAGLAVFAVAFLTVRTTASPLVDRWGGPRTTIVTSMVSAAGFVVLALAKDVPLALTGAAIVGLGLSLALPATVATTLARTGSAGSGNAVATATSYWDLGILVAGPITGALIAVSGFPAVFAVAALAAAVAFVLSVVLKRSARRRAPVPVAVGS